MQGEYLLSCLNNVWTLDTTTIKRKYFCFFIMDLASRRIVGYELLDHDYTSKEAIHILEKTLLLETLVKPPRPVSSVDTDSVGIFLSKDWQEYLEVNEIAPSSSDSKTMQNQVSERLNRTFKVLLRDFLNKKLNKKNNKTNTLQLIGEATNYNFENLKTLTEEIVVYYKTKRSHQHLNECPPESWAYGARRIPDYKFILREKQLLDNRSVEIDSKIIEKPQDNINSMNLLEKFEIVLFVQLAKKNNSVEAKEIRELKKNVGVLNLRELVFQNKTNVSEFDVLRKKVLKIYQEIMKIWKKNFII